MMNFVSRLFGLSSSSGNDNVNNNVVVYGIFDANITINEIHEKFSKFGNISSLNFLHNEQMCYITFSNSTAAQNAIDSTPDPYHVFRQDWAYQEENENPKSKLDILNPYVMLAITNYMEMTDRLCLSMAFPQFRYILKHYAEIELSEIDLKDFKDLDTCQLFELFKVCGSVFTSISSAVTMDLQRATFLANCIAFYCTECTSLTIWYDEPELELFRKVVQNMKSLVAVKLFDCAINDKDLLCIPNPTILRKLALTNNDNITGRMLHRFTNLRKLTLRNCGIRPILLMGALKKMPLLYSLDVWHCETRNICFQMLARYSRKIEDLYFSYMPILTFADFHKFHNLKRLTFNYNAFEPTAPNFPHALLKNLIKSSPKILSLKILMTNCLRASCFSNIARINSLRQLVIPDQNELTDPILWRLANLPYLEELNISRCTGFTNIGLATFCERCTTLKSLSIANCYFINHIFINLLIHTRKNKLGNFPVVIIYAKGSGVLKSFATSIRVRRYKKLLSIRYFNHSLDWHTNNFLYDNYQSSAYIFDNDGSCAVCDD